MGVITEDQKEVVRWLVQQTNEGNLPKEFSLSWTVSGPLFHSREVDRHNVPPITKLTLMALEDAGMLVKTVSSKGTSWACALTGEAYEAVASNFRAPDTSFVTHLTPLADITSLDNEIKTRCLPTLGAGSADPKLWDSAIRTAGVILEERLRDVGRIADQNRVGRDLVNAVFGQNGTLVGGFAVDSERQGYRDLYAGVVGAFRNPYGHRFVDPTPEDGGAFLVFVNLLLKMLEDLR